MPQEFDEFSGLDLSVVERWPHARNGYLSPAILASKSEPPPRRNAANAFFQEGIRRYEGCPIKNLTVGHNLRRQPTKAVEVRFDFEAVELFSDVKQIDTDSAGSNSKLVDQQHVGSHPREFLAEGCAYLGVAQLRRRGDG